MHTVETYWNHFSTCNSCPLIRDTQQSFYLTMWSLNSRTRYKRQYLAHKANSRDYSPHLTFTNQVWERMGDRLRSHSQKKEASGWESSSQGSVLPPWPAQRGESPDTTHDLTPLCPAHPTQMQTPRGTAWIAFPVFKDCGNDGLLSISTEFSTQANCFSASLFHIC